MEQLHRSTFCETALPIW